MTKLASFLSKEEEQEIVSAIRSAEKDTSGEIRVHIGSHTDENHFEHALQVFQQQEMHKTQLRNGVLIYIAVDDHTFVILGDEGINKAVADNFWDTTKDTMQAHFRKGDFKTGIVAGVLQAGNQLKKHFPYQQDDTDELSNEISRNP